MTFFFPNFLFAGSEDLSGAFEFYREASLDCLAKILHEFFHAIALCGAARYGWDFGPEAPLLIFIFLDLHFDLGSRLSRGNPSLSSARPPTPPPAHSPPTTPGGWRGRAAPAV